MHMGTISRWKSMSMHPIHTVQNTNTDRRVCDGSTAIYLLLWTEYMHMLGHGSIGISISISSVFAQRASTIRYTVWHADISSHLISSHRLQTRVFVDVDFGKLEPSLLLLLLLRSLTVRSLLLFLMFLFFLPLGFEVVQHRTESLACSAGRLT